MNDEARSTGHRIATSLLGFAAAAASWALRPGSRRLASAPKPEIEARVGEHALAT